jgi:hypothetical protein
MRDCFDKDFLESALISSSPLVEFALSVPFVFCFLGYLWFAREDYLLKIGA